MRRAINQRLTNRGSKFLRKLELLNHDKVYNSWREISYVITHKYLLNSNETVIEWFYIRLETREKRKEKNNTKKKKKKETRI